MLHLKKIDLKNEIERKKLLSFVNDHYTSPMPLEERDLLKDKYCFYWAYTQAEECIGCTGYTEKTRALVETVKTVVSPLHRGKGYGEALSLAIEEEIRRLGYKKIFTTIYITNLPMIFIKLKQGYRFEGFHPDHEKPGLDEYSLGKRLT